MLVNFDHKFQLELAGVEITGDSVSLAYRETAEQWIQEDNYSFSRTRLSRHNFTDNQVLHQLAALAYNPGNFLRLMIITKS